MAIFGNDSVADLLNYNLLNDEEELLNDANDGGQIFATSEQADTENQNAPIKVQPKKRNVVNPRPRLNVEVLRGPRGLHTIEDYFKGITFKGKGKEKENIDEVMRRLQHWGHRMYPNYKFDDVLTNIERLGKKKSLQVHMARYRQGMLESIINHGEINDDVQRVASADEPYDEFDALLDEQIAISKVDPRTPKSSHSKYSDGGMCTTNSSVSSTNVPTPFSRDSAVISTTYPGLNDTSDVVMSLTPSQPSTPISKQQQSTEQMARIVENRRLAKERLANRNRLHQAAQKAPQFIQL